MTDWDERFRAGEYPREPEPSPVLRHYVEEMPSGRALDVATGTGRNALFLAETGYTVDAVDKSRVGLQTARETASQRGIDDRVNWIQADVGEYCLPTERYEVITISFYRVLDRFPDLKEALVPGGYLFVEHHLRSTEPVSLGPDSDRYRFAANELLHSCLDLTVIHYDETTEEHERGRGASARLLARRSTGTRQSYPRRPPGLARDGGR